MGNLWQDLKYATRSLTKNVGSTAVAVVILGLGIGANTAIFSILDPLLVRTLPVQKPEELVRIGAAGYMGSLEISEAAAFRIYREKSEVFSGVFAFAPETSYDLNRSGEVISATGEIVSGNYFSVLGVRPFTGRLLIPDDERNGPTVVLSFDCWRRTFAANPNVVGQIIQLSNTSYTVVGVAPPEFFGMEIGKSPDFYLPLTAAGPTHTEWMDIFGRLKPGVSVGQAQASLGSIFQEVAQTSSIPKVELNEWMERVDLTSASRGLSKLRAQFSLPVRVLMAVLALVLLIACANVANLLLTRAVSRRKELSLKQALGAGRWRLVQQLLAESFLLILLGAVVGLLFRQWITSSLIAAISSERLPFTLAATFNFRIVIFVFGLLLVTTLLCGLAPAFYATRLELMTDLKVHETASSGASQLRITTLLVVAQVAFSVTVLAGASLLLHSLVNLETFDVGFDRDHVLLVSLHSHDRLPPGGLASLDEQLSERLKKLPGVRSVSWSGFSPISGHKLGVNVMLEGYTLRAGENAHAFLSPISTDYFQTLGIPLLEGRDFTFKNVRNRSNTAIINLTMAHRFFEGRSPLGKHLQMMVEGNHPPLEIVGVVADSKYNDLREGALPFFYYPTSSSLTLEIRSVGDPRPLEASLPALVRSLDSSISIATIKTLRAQVDESLHFERVIAGLCGAFGLLALALTCVGLYGTLTFRVIRRTKEIGIRMALGAHSRDILRAVVGQGIVLTAMGALFGAAGAIAVTFLLRSLLFNVRRSDPLTLIAVPLLLLISATLACYIPARRAARVDPMVALRYE